MESKINYLLRKNRLQLLALRKKLKNNLRKRRKNVIRKRKIRILIT